MKHEACPATELQAGLSRGPLSDMNGLSCSELDLHPVLHLAKQHLLE